MGIFNLVKRLNLNALILAGALSTYSLANPQENPDMTFYSNEQSKPASLDVLKEWMETDGKLLVDLYKKSNHYPYGCIVMSNIVNLLLDNEGIESRVAEGYVEEDSLFVNRNHYHMFNTVFVNNGGGLDEYVLDFTANQFTLKINKYTEDEVLYFEVVEPQKGNDIIPYFKRLSESPYRITNYSDFDGSLVSKEFNKIYLKVLKSR
jgi:hypothetical protein